MTRISLVKAEKGQRISLTKDNPGLDKIAIQLGWSPNAGGQDFDLDISAFGLDAQGKCQNENFLFYNQLQVEGMAHSGDERVGSSEGDAETINVELSRIPSSVEKIVFATTIHEGDARNQNFGMANNAYVKVYDSQNNAELIQFDLSEDYSINKSIVVCELYRHNGEWKFNASGEGSSNDLGALCSQYGMDV